MAIREIVTEGYESLSKISKPVTTFDNRLKTLVQDMKDTLINADGLGLAAPQIAVLKRIAVIVDETGDIITLINPEIIAFEGSQNVNEGCLSIPHIWGKTERPAKVTVRAFDVNGESYELTREGITAVAICHETDHLNGILFRAHVIEYIDEDDLREQKKRERRR